MKYKFKINNICVTLKVFYKSLSNESTSQEGDLEEKIHELLKTGNVHFSYSSTTYTIEACDEKI